MSSPMFNLPEHFPLPVNMYGQGPEDDDRLVARIVCWCGDEYCVKFKEWEAASYRAPH